MITAAYITNGPATPNTFADIDWDEWDRPSAECLTQWRKHFAIWATVIVPKRSACNIICLALEDEGFIRRVTQDKASVTWVREVHP